MAVLGGLKFLMSQVPLYIACFYLHTAIALRGGEKWPFYLSMCVFVIVCKCAVPSHCAGSDAMLRPWEEACMPCQATDPIRL